jgi:hypothetical protein
MTTLFTLEYSELQMCLQTKLKIKINLQMFQDFKKAHALGLVYNY